ncbi:MAG: FmdE family protein [Acidobacteriota bacterium]|jgi:formylmethanofuran dehydrogenase subunit E|nr:FmdE family protein [Acidobacteriota bacterium]
MAIYDLDNYENLLAEAGAFHGDICGGIRIGTRMTMCGLRRLGIGDPKGEDKRKLLVFVEIDRCATDAIMALTGCRPGKRSMKVKDYGKMAATFINLETGKAVRIVPTGANRKETADGKEPDLAKMSDEELFVVKDVEVPLRPEDLPGKPVRRAVCARCGEDILDGREVEAARETLCRPCFEQKNYYRVLG